MLCNRIIFNNQREKKKEKKNYSITLYDLDNFII